MKNCLPTAQCSVSGSRKMLCSRLTFWVTLQTPALKTKCQTSTRMKDYTSNICKREPHICSLSRITTQLLRRVRFLMHFTAVQEPLKHGLRTTKIFTPHLPFYSKQPWIFLGMLLSAGKCLSVN